MLSEELQQFVRLSIRSVWALEILLLLRRRQERAWSVDEIVLELRSSAAAVNGALEALEHAGLTVSGDDGTHRYRPAIPALDALVAEIEAAYAKQPMTVIKTILSAPDAKIKSFADAFKLKKD
ncbi:MAG TPA: hypothetical protein VEB20_24120 [Azospirillaceae bacterium]|nr:hypothetical protein [Azospirillaceae bacterium]